MVVEVLGSEISADQKQAYLTHIKEKIGASAFRAITQIIIKIDGDFVNLEWHFSPAPFDRIRRITGYLVGTLDRFNDGKRAEEADRVHHGYDEECYQQIHIYEGGELNGNQNTAAQ